MFPGESMPRYMEVPVPAAAAEGELLVSVKAVAIKHLDKSRAAGRHYSSSDEAPSGEGRVVGGDGVCVLADGSRVYAIGVSGMMAEQAVVDGRRMVPVPAGVDDVVAAALPNAVIGSAMGLRFKADIQPGEVVLINGATGFTGSVAVQLARHYGAGRVIATGRNEEALQALLALGADQVVSVASGDFGARIAAIHRATPVDVVIDYLWGASAEVILGCLKGDGGFTNRIRYVSIGSMGGDVLRLSAAVLRSADIVLAGSGLGAWSREQVARLFSGILPEMFGLAAAGKLVVRTHAVGLAAIGELWEREARSGERLVVVI